MLDNNKTTKDQIKKENIILTEGRNKYVLLEDHLRNNHVVSMDLPWHAQIFESMNEEMNKNGQPEFRAVGGGVINFNSLEGTVEVFGESGSYGKADHELTKSILKETFGSEYAITTELDIEKKNKKEREEMLEQTRNELGTGMIDLIKSLPESAQISFYKNIDKIEMLDKDVLKEHLLDRAKYNHINSANDIDFIIDALDKSGLIYEDVGGKYRGNILNSITERCAEFDYPLDKIAEALHKSPIDENGASVERRMQKIIGGRISDYESYKEAITDSMRYTNESFTKSVISNGAEKVVQEKDFRRFAEDYKSFLQEKGFDTDVIDEVAKNYVETNLGRQCFWKDEFLEKLEDMVSYFGLEAGSIQNLILDNIKERIDTNHDGNGPVSGFRYIKKLTDRFGIPLDDYKQDVIDSIKSTDLDSLLSKYMGHFGAMGSVLSMGNEADLMVENAFAEEIKSGKDVFDYLVELVDRMDMNYNISSAISTAAIKDIAEQIIESGEIQRHIDSDTIESDTEGNFYRSILGLKSNLNKKNIELDKELLNQEQKDTIYGIIREKSKDSHYKAEKAFNFAREFLDTERIHEFAITYFNKCQASSLDDGLMSSRFIKDNNLDTSRFARIAEQAYDDMGKRIIEREANPHWCGYQRLNDYERLGNFAKDMDLPQEYETKAFGKAFEGYLASGSVEGALRIAEKINHPMKDNLERVYDVIGK